MDKDTTRGAVGARWFDGIRNADIRDFIERHYDAVPYDDIATLIKAVYALQSEAHEVVDRPALLRKWDETKAATPGDPANAIAPALPRVTFAEYIATLSEQQRAILGQSGLGYVERLLADPLAYVCPSCGRGYHE